MSDVVLFEKRSDGVAVVSLNRPEKRNALNWEAAEAIDAAVKRTEADPEIGAVVLTATTDEVFCAGADLAVMAQGARPMVTEDGGFGGFVLQKRTKPWIAAPKGKVVGGGFELCLACEMIVAADTCSFFLPEAKRGLLALAGGATRLPKIIPFPIAIEMILTGEPLSVQRAYDLGLVNHITAPSDTVEKAISIGRIIAANPRYTATEGMRLARAAVTLSDDEGWALCREAQVRMMDNMKVATEGAKAFMEKRDPNWAAPK